MSNSLGFYIVYFENFFGGHWIFPLRFGGPHLDFSTAIMTSFDGPHLDFSTAIMTSFGGPHLDFSTEIMTSFGGPHFAVDIRSTQ